MAGRIPQDFINDLLERIDIAEVVGARVQLKKAGREYKALCPFHGEKTPSFHVVPEKGFYHCFGCGEHGTALTFLLEHDRMEFVEAIETLAGMAGVEVQREDGPVRQDDGRARLLEIVDRADRWFRQQLRSHPQREKAISYLRGRGIDGETAKTFGIGYAPPGYHNLLAGLGGDDATRKSLVDAGLLAVGDDGREPYDRFRDRIMFPIRDVRGRTVAFGGRLLGDGRPKYLNSPESPLFHKGRELYGLWECKRALRNPERVLLVEGYMDVIALARAGIPEACASLGTAATRDHLLKLFRVAPEVVFCFDGDEAGRRAAWKAVTTALEVLEDGVAVRLLFLPEGEDPDSLVQSEGAEAFRARFAGATPLSEYLFDALAVDLDTSVLDGRSRLAHRAMPLIDRIPGPVVRALMLRRLAELAQMPAEDLQRILDAGHEASVPARAGRGERPAPAAPGPEEGSAGMPDEMPDLSAYEQDWPLAAEEAEADAPPAPARSSPARRNSGRIRRSKEDQAAAYLLRRPELAARIAPARLEHLELLEREAVTALTTLIRRLHEEPGLATATLVAEQMGTAVYERLRTLAQLEIMLDDAGMEREFDEAVTRLEREAVDARRSALMARIRAGEASDAEILEHMALKRAAAGIPAIAASAAHEASGEQDRPSDAASRERGGA